MRIAKNFVGTMASHLIQTGQMEEEDAIELIRRSIGDSNFPTEEASKLVSKFIGLPLGLALMRQNSMTVIQYLKLLDDSNDTFRDLGDPDFFVDYQALIGA
jgi:hypothetical protein